MVIGMIIMMTIKINDEEHDVRRKYESYLCSSFFPDHSQLGAAADQLDSIPNQMSYISPAPPKPAPHRYHLRRFTFFHPCAASTAQLILRCAATHGILVILPPADAIYLIITIHKSHPRSQHPPQGTHTHKKV